MFLGRLIPTLKAHKDWHRLPPKIPQKLLVSQPRVSRMRLRRHKNSSTLTMRASRLKTFLRSGIGLMSKDMTSLLKSKIKELVGPATWLPAMPCLSLESGYGLASKLIFQFRTDWTATTWMKAVMEVGASSTAFIWSSTEQSMPHVAHLTLGLSLLEAAHYTLNVRKWPAS